MHTSKHNKNTCTCLPADLYFFNLNLWREKREPGSKRIDCRTYVRYGKHKAACARGGVSKPPKNAQKRGKYDEQERVPEQTYPPPPAPIPRTKAFGKSKKASNKRQREACFTVQGIDRPSVTVQEKTQGASAAPVEQRKYSSATTRLRHDRRIRRLHHSHTLRAQHPTVQQRKAKSSTVSGKNYGDPPGRPTPSHKTNTRVRVSTSLFITWIFPALDLASTMAKSQIWGHRL